VIHPAPKPVPAHPKRKQFGSTLPAPESNTLGRNAERQAKEFARSYGSDERVEWFKALGCCICGKRPSENAHSRGGGAGRKADAHYILPLCRSHHRELHQEGIETFEASYSINLDATADEFDKAYQRSLQEHTP
jgi:hypothetical protein